MREDKGREPRPSEMTVTTEHLKVGQRIVTRTKTGWTPTVITSIFDRYTVGTPFGSRWAGDIRPIE